MVPSPIVASTFPGEANGCELKTIRPADSNSEIALIDVQNEHQSQ
jgi:hypothetical protein